MGEQGHFRRASSDPKNGDQAYALLRFDNEVHRIYGVMNLGLRKKRYLAAGAVHNCRIICYPWATRTAIGLINGPRAVEDAGD
jgi:GSH-dependent disulfide-bond oxidoreductase